MKPIEAKETQYYLFDTQREKSGFDAQTLVQPAR